MVILFLLIFLSDLLFQIELPKIFWFPIHWSESNILKDSFTDRVLSDLCVHLLKINYKTWLISDSALIPLMLQEGTKRGYTFNWSERTRASETTTAERRKHNWAAPGLVREGSGHHKPLPHLDSRQSVDCLVLLNPEMSQQ